jgi:hypothetical protein
MSWPYMKHFSFKLAPNDRVNNITSSLNRYGHIILQAPNKKELEVALDEYEMRFHNMCFN